MPCKNKKAVEWEREKKNHWTVTCALPEKFTSEYELINGACLCAPTYTYSTVHGPTHWFTQHKFNIKMWKCKQGQTSEQHDNILFFLERLCPPVKADTVRSAGWSSLMWLVCIASAAVCVLLQVENRVVRCWGHWETVLQTHPKAWRSGGEGTKGLGGQDQDTLLFLQLLLVPSCLLVPHYFIFSFLLSRYIATKIQ